MWSRRWQREKLALSLAVKLRVSIKTENSRCNLEYLVKTLTSKCVLTFPVVLSSQLRFASCVLGVLRLFTKKLAKKDANFNGDFCFVRCFSVHL